jgi:hypothetical protein
MGNYHQKGKKKTARAMMAVVIIKNLNKLPHIKE